MGTNRESKSRKIQFALKEVLFEPILLPAAIFMFFGEIQAIASTSTVANLSGDISMDIINHWYIYLIFTLVFYGYVILRARESREERKDREHMLDTLDGINKTLDERKKGDGTK
jgi:hypothetical protein